MGATPSDSPDRRGGLVPVIDRNRCEGKAECVRVCPYQVFRIGVLSDQQFRELSLRGKFKAWVHGSKQAMVVNGDSCHACRLCEAACPEQAIVLARRAAPTVEKASS